MTHHNKKIHSSDEWEFKMAIYEKDGVIILDWGKPVAWIGLWPWEVLALINLLKKHIQ